MVKEKKIQVKEFEGFLFAKLANIGSKSEGPVYFLQLWDLKELRIEKKVHPWEIDPMLHPVLAKKVRVVGEREEGQIRYKRISELDPPGELDIHFKLDLPDDILWVDRTLPHGHYPSELRHVDMTLSVYWPYRGIWYGKCPTSKLFEFTVEDEGGYVVWEWGKCLPFQNEETKVELMGGRYYSFPVQWFFYNYNFKVDGTYVARARFNASGQELKKAFDVKFIY